MTTQDRLQWILPLNANLTLTSSSRGFEGSLSSFLAIGFICIILDALIDAGQQALVANVIPDALEDLLVDMPGIGCALVGSCPHEHPPQLLATPAAFYDLVFEVARVLVSREVDFCTCAVHLFNEQAH